MVGSRLVSNGLFFLGDTLIDIHLVTFYYYPMLVNEELGQKLKSSDNHNRL